jgi:DNA-damage-inducible protein D
MGNITNYSQESFENSKHVDGNLEFWMARELMVLLGYDSWRRFADAIDRAKQSCKESWRPVEEHFLPAPSKTASEEGWRPKEDYFLTRLACYLIAMNGDPRKTEIAQAQQYFAIQTRKQELSEKQIEDEKRLVARSKLSESEAKVEETVYHRWISHPIEFASFKNSKILALYNISTRDLKAKRWIPEHRALADFDSEVELKAKDFIYAMTDHNIKTKNIIGKTWLTQEVVENAKSTRKNMIERWIVPEELPAQEDLKLIIKKKNKSALQSKWRKLT